MLNISRFPSIITNYIETQWLNLSPSIEIFEDQLIPTLATQSSQNPPFRAFFEDFTLQDHSYAIHTILNLQIPSNSCILVEEWHLIYDREMIQVKYKEQVWNSALTLVVTSARVINDINTYKTEDVIMIDQNPAVDEVLRNFKFRQIFLQMQDLKENSQKSENSDNFIYRLETIIRNNNLDTDVFEFKRHQDFIYSEICKKEGHQDDADSGNKFYQINFEKGSEFQSEQIENNKHAKKGLSQLNCIKEIIEKEDEELFENEINLINDIKKHEKLSDARKSNESLMSRSKSYQESQPKSLIKIKTCLNIDFFPPSALEILKQQFNFSSPV